MIDQSFSEVFASALDGAPTVVVGLGDEPMALPVDLWSRTADDSTTPWSRSATGPTLDIGCGPGRLTEALARRGHIALGIDVVDAAVDAHPRARRLGAAARRLRRACPARAAGTPRCSPTATSASAATRSGCCGGCASSLAPGRPGRRRGRRARHRVVRGLGARSSAATAAAGPSAGPSLGVDDVATVAAPPGCWWPRVHRLGDRWAAAAGATVLDDAAMRTADARTTSPRACAAPRSPHGSGSGSASPSALCFVTGLVSHYAQLPVHPIPFPTSPSWGYRLTQGLHVTSGRRRDPAAAGQAVVGPAQALRGPAAARPRGGCC